MKITLDIKEDRFAAFFEFIKTLDYVSVTKNEDIIPKEHQSIVLERIANTNENDLLDWDKVKDDFDGI